ncbi:MAG TPA: hypothetical protein DHN29_12255 [Cytophagales bacterium]|nr:hypothetical protein [Cytophagales bacterium]
MATGKFIEIWKQVLEDGVMGEEFTTRIRKEFDKAQKGYDPKVKYKDDKMIWKRIKNKMTAIRQAAASAGVDMKLPTIKYSHSKSTGRKLDYQGFYDSLKSAAKPSAGDDYKTKVIKKKKKADKAS